MPTINLKVATKNDGTFEDRATVKPPIIRDEANVRLRARRIDSINTTVYATLDIDAVDGRPQNHPRDFVFERGWEVDMGVWRVDKRENAVFVSGRTDPPVRDGTIEVEIEASLAFGRA